MATDKAFQDLPTFDARDFEPPEWASSSRFDWGKKKNGESSTAASSSAAGRNMANDAEHHYHNGGSDDEDEDDVFVDASEGASIPDLEELEDLKFSTAELKQLLAKATQLKTKGNNKFTSSPPDHGAAIDAYQSALACLPPCPKANSPEAAAPPPPPTGGIQEVTDEQATAIEAEQKAALELKRDPSVQEREDVEEEIRQCTKACWGNLAACYIAQGDDTEAVRACTRALEIDPHYAKGLYRRASANDRLGTWASLNTAKDDYTLFLTLVPRSSQQAVLARKALLTLPQRIQVQQEKEKDEMLGKLKELGNGLLGKFGISTDMFKFDQQEGGGYNMRFES